MGKYARPRVRDPTRKEPDVQKLLGWVGASAGSWIGWAAGAHISIFVAFMLSIVGTGIGMYAGRRFAQRYS